MDEIKEKVLKSRVGEEGVVIMKSFLDMVERDGVDKGKSELIYHMLRNHQTPEQVSMLTGESLEYIHKVEEGMLQVVQEESNYQVD